MRTLFVLACSMGRLSLRILETVSKSNSGLFPIVVSRVTTSTTLPDICLDTVISRKLLVQQCRGVLGRRLGLQYLWVDALCIIQDNEDYWRKESQMMAAIYGNALLTIAASCAESPTDGFPLLS